MYAEENPPPPPPHHHHPPPHPGNPLSFAPPPPPPTRFRIHRHQSRGGTGCCCLDCLCECALCCIISVIFSILFVIGLVVLVFWLIVHPHEIKFHATSASLTQFSLASTTDILSYNVAVNFTVRNPNRHIRIYYDQIDARAYYKDQIFGTTGLQGFYQGHKNTSDLGPAAFSGQNVLELTSGQVSDFNTERSNGVFPIQVKLFLRVRFRLGIFKTGHYKPEVECDLKVPLDGASTDFTFQSTRCHYHL
ncbi:yls9-like [Dionaea muscipula]